MSPKEIKNLSPNEWKVMKVVWELHSSSAQEVFQITREKFDMSLPYTKLILHRLLEKGHLKTRKVGNSYLYMPVSDIVKELCNATDDLLDETSQSAVDEVMMHIVKKGRLTSEGLKRLRTVLDDLNENKTNDS